MGRLSISASLGQAAWAARRQWRALPVDRRDRLQALLRRAAGGPSNLSPADRQELRGLIAELNLGNVVRDSAMRAARSGSRRR
jgi:hypothetical protein